MIQYLGGLGAMYTEQFMAGRRMAQYAMAAGRTGAAAGAGFPGVQGGAGAAAGTGFPAAQDGTGTVARAGSPAAQDGAGAAAVGRDGRGRRPDYDTYECQTCRNRKYKDGSNDPGVSFKTATRVSPERAAYAVRSHEMEHVVRERAKAQREDREVVSQTVTYRTGICPECGRTYVAGGTTRTVTRGRVSQAPGEGGVEKGKYLDLVA